jgi:hypothetical protein
MPLIYELLFPNSWHKNLGAANTRANTVCHFTTRYPLQRLFNVKWDERMTVYGDLGWLAEFIYLFIQFIMFI